MNHEANDPNGEMPLERTQVPALEAILGQSFPVLDHGFIRIIDYMGSDDSIVQAARVSYGKGTRSLNDDTALIRYLMRNSHTTPFEMCEIKLHVKLPIFVARQWIRHRTANINEYSGRYSIINNQYYVPTQEAIAAQSAINRQGRGQSLDDMNAKAAIALIREDSERSYACYQALMGDETSSGPIEGGIARELARIGLGVNFYTQWYWKIDLHNLMHFLSLRADDHAQFEIRQYANVILDILRAWVPISYQAFLDYRLNAATLSAPALQVIKRRLAGVRVEFAESGLSKREWDDLEQLLNSGPA